MMPRNLRLPLLVTAFAAIAAGAFYVGTADASNTRPAAELAAAAAAPATDWYSALKLVQLDGTPLPADTLRGKAVLFVNTASQCGFTKQYDGLQALWTRFKDRGLVVVGAPCNQFMGQEPGTNEQIASFCKLKFGVDFPLLDKMDVNGKERSSLYGYLVNSAVGGGADIRWNFEKFLVTRSGDVVGRWRSQVTPDDPAFVAAIEAALPPAR
jgi:glutathione peroxidase